MFCCEFCEISKNTFFTEHLWMTDSISAKSASRTLSISKTVLKNLVKIHRKIPVPVSLFSTFAGI